MVTTIVNTIITYTCILIFTLSISLCDCKSFSDVYVAYDSESQVYSFTAEQIPGWVAHARFENEVNKTGWAFLHVETNASYSDKQQAYASGLGEGYLTEELIRMHWTNTLQGYCQQPYSHYCSNLLTYLSTNLQWMKSNIEDKAQDQPFWHHVELFLLQTAGLSDGVKKQPSMLNMNIDPFGLYMFQVGGDFDDLESVLGKSVPSQPKGSGSCSALVKLLPGNTDLYVAQDTWTTFQSMLRILKVYDFPFHMTDIDKQVPGRVQAFSSYPGTLMSGDDFYLLSSGLVSLETTIGNSNPDLWKYVTTDTVLEGIRSVVANRLSLSGTEWAQFFSIYNSGTIFSCWCLT